MTLADIIIVIVVVVVLGSIVYMKIKNKDKTTCSSCAYAPKRPRHLNK